MCEWCSPRFATDGFSVVERPAQSLLGRFWEGSNAEAAAGATRDLIARVQAFARSAGDLWIGPVVTLSWNERPEGFRFFAGVETALSAEGFERFACPASGFVTTWHDGKGDVLDGYEAMLAWMRAAGHSWDKRLLHHREEYAVHEDVSAQPAMRLMLPVES